MTDDVEVIVQLPPINIPVVDRTTGMVNDQWYRFFETLFDRVGGGVDKVQRADGTAATAEQGVQTLTEEKANGSNEIQAGRGLEGGGPIGQSTVTLDVKQNTGWTPGTGMANKGAFTAYGGQTVSAAFDQAEMQAIDDAARDTSRRVLAIEQAMRANEGIDG